MESAEKDEVELDAVLATPADASDDCEETTPADKLLLVERGGGMLRKQLTQKNEARIADQGQKIRKKFWRKY